MTGRLLVDGRAPIERLEYSSDRLDPAWIRFALGFEGGGRLEVVDPRRLGGVAPRCPTSPASASTRSP